MRRRHANACRALAIGRASLRLQRTWRAVAPELREAGAEWYPAAFRQCAAMRPDDPRRAAAVVAVLSPQVRWTENLRAARRILADPYVAFQAPDRAGLPGYPRNWRKAAAIAQGAPYGTGPGDGFGAEAPKVRAFWAALCGDEDSVTLDVWAMRAAYPAGSWRPPSGDAYARGVLAYRAAARAISVAPRTLQAATWLHVRGAVAYARDRMAAGQLAMALGDAGDAMATGGHDGRAPQAIPNPVAATLQRP